MKKVESVVSQVNIFDKPLEINFEADARHGIFLPFLATLVLIAIVCTSTISSIIDLFTYKKITVTGYHDQVVLLLFRIHLGLWLMGPSR